MATAGVTAAFPMSCILCTNPVMGSLTTEAEHRHSNFNLRATALPCLQSPNAPRVGSARTAMVVEAGAIHRWRELP